MSNSKNDFILYKMENIDHPSLLPNLREINELAQTKANCLEMLRKELQSLPDIDPCLEENFLLRFLRVSKFNAAKALQRIVKYYQQQEILLDSLKKVSLPMQKARRCGNYIWLSPYRLKDNSTLAFALGGKIDYSEITFAERMYLDVLAVNGIFENPVTQISGITAIFDYKGFNLRSFLAHTPSWLKVFAETFLYAFPARIKAFHLVNAPSLFLAAFKIIYPLFPTKLQGRIFMHPNDDWKSLHSEIPPEVLPEEYGGKLKFDSFINVFKDIEQLEDHFLPIFKFGYLKTKARRQSFRPICKRS